jgi:hypothetical protein
VVNPIVTIFYLSLVPIQYHLSDRHESEDETSLFRNRESHTAIELDVFIRKYESFIVRRSYKGNRLSSLCRSIILAVCRFGKKSTRMICASSYVSLRRRPCISSRNTSSFVSLRGVVAWEQSAASQTNFCLIFIFLYHPLSSAYELRNGSYFIDYTACVKYRPSCTLCGRYSEIRATRVDSTLLFFGAVLLQVLSFLHNIFVLLSRRNNCTDF